MDKLVQAVIVRALSILRSKLTVTRAMIGQSVSLVVVGNGTVLERGAVLYNTNVTTPERLKAAVDMLTADGAIESLKDEAEATEFTRNVLNAASIAFSIPVERGVALHGGDDVVAEVQEYLSSATNALEIGLRYKRIARPEVLVSNRNNGAINELLKGFGIAPSGISSPVIVPDPFANSNVEGNQELAGAGSGATPRRSRRK